MNRPPKNMISVTRNTHMPSAGGLDLLLHVVEVVLQLRMVRVLDVHARLNGVHIGHQRRLVNRTWKMLGVGVRQCRPPGSGAYWCVPCGDDRRHREVLGGRRRRDLPLEPLAPHGSSAAFSPATSE